MTTIFLGGDLISYEDQRLSHLPKYAREAAYFEQFKEENLREIRAVPMLVLLATLLIGSLTLGSFFGNDAIQSRPGAVALEPAHPPSPPQPSLEQRRREASEIRPPSQQVELLMIGEP